MNKFIDVKLNTKALFKNLSVTLIFSLTLISQELSAAQSVTGNRCQNLFSNFFEIPSYQPYKSGLDPQSLSKAHLLIEGDQLFDTANGSKILIGKLLSLDAKYLFEWADKDTEMALKKWGMSQAWMDEIIKGPAQTAGKGFYVSLDPTDSASYGKGNDTGLTVFKTTSMIVLEVPMPVMMSNLKYNTELTNRIRSAGVDALRFQGYRITWLSVIQDKPLRQQVSLPLEVINYVSQKETTDYNSILRYLKATFKNRPAERKVLPANHSLRKLLQGKNLTIDDIVAIEKNPNGLQNLDQSMVDFLVNQSFRLVKDVKSPDDLVALIKFLESVPESNAGRIASQYGSPKLASKNTVVYKGILELFDAYEVARLTSKSKEELMAAFSDMKKRAAEYVNNKSKIDLKSITNFQQLVQAGEKIFGVRFKYRSSNIFMTDGGKPIEVTAQSYKMLNLNPLLTVKETDDKPKTPGNKSIYVRYFTLDKISKAFYPVTSMTGPMKVAIEEVIQGLKSGIDEKLLLPQFLKAANEKVFDKTIINDLTAYNNNPAESRTAEEVYRVFMGLHPFEDVNGRLGRLLYEVLSAHDGNLQPNTLNLVAHDFDLTLNGSQMKKQLIVGTLLQNWILLAKDDMDFISRSYWAVELLSRANPELRGNFTGVEPITP